MLILRDFEIIVNVMLTKNKPSVNTNKKERTDVKYEKLVLISYDSYVLKTLSESLKTDLKLPLK